MIYLAFGWALVWDWQRSMARKVDVTSVTSGRSNLARGEAIWPGELTGEAIWVKSGTSKVGQGSLTAENPQHDALPEEILITQMYELK